MISYNEALQKVLSFDPKQESVEVHIIESLGKILAQDINSQDDIPAFNNSAMDGYAVRAVDIIGADKNYPVRLELLKDVLPAGKILDLKLVPGSAVQIMTGALLPDGCDCVVPKEDCLKEGSSVLIFKEYKSGDNIRLKGEDIKAGQTVLKRGKKIYPADIGVMASLGIENVFIYKPPVVGIIATGDELIPISQKLEAGKVRDSNSFSLASQVLESGASYKMYGIIKDDKMLIKENILKALSQCDILLLSGGISVGDYDFAKEVLGEIGAEFVFWKVNQRPGKPLAFLTYKNKFIFGLPGNPVSVMVCFELYVRPLIKKIMGEPNLFRKKIIAKAAEDYKHKQGRTDFVRVKLEKIGSDLFFRLTGMQGSGILTSMSEADGIAEFPDDTGEIIKGSEVKVYILKDIW